MSRDQRVEGARWLAQAESDLSDARYLAADQRFAMACFLAQQCAEKALKAVLYAEGADLVLGHGVGKLCQEVSAVLPDQAGRCSEWRGLDLYYVPTRYPDALPDGIPATTFTSGQASHAIALAAEVVEFAAGRLDL